MDFTTKSDSTEIAPLNKIVFLRALDIDIRRAKDEGLQIVYIAGKVTGLDPIEVKAKFAAKAAEMKLKGFFVLNPCDYIRPDENWQVAMRIAFVLLMMADCIAMIYDWQLSEGAKLEFITAAKFGIPVIED